jgi:lysophospholipase L1-like esterase
MSDNPGVMAKARRGFLYLIYLLAATLIVLLMLEGGLRLAARVSGPAGEMADLRIKSEAFAGEAWVKECFREISDIRMVWQSYVYWRGAEFHGTCVNIDKSGVRRSWNPTCATGNKKTKIFMFGGSAMWGYVARDDFTIPSVVSRVLSETTDACVQVTNFGETGYVITQEVIALMRLLEKGERPDIVIFYDGVNDVFSAFQNGVAGLPQNEINRIREFNILSAKTMTLIETFVPILIKRTQIYRTLSAIAAGGKESVEGGWAMGKTGSKIESATAERLAGKVAGNYAANLQVVEALAEKYGFVALFYWQPTVFGKDKLTPYEVGIVNRMAALRGPFLHVSNAVAESPDVSRRPSFHDLSQIFAGTDRPVFIDFCHVSEKGNEIVGRRIAADVLSVLK